MNNSNYRRSCFWWFPIRFNTYEIVKHYDDYELIWRKGFFSRSEERLKLYRVNDISFHRSFGNFLFGVGNVIVRSSDASSKSLTITKIRNYREFGKLLDDVAHKERQRVGVKYEETNLIR